MTGYNHKMRVLVEKVIDKITNFKVEPDRFFVIKVRGLFSSLTDLSSLFIVQPDSNSED